MFLRINSPLITIALLLASAAGTAADANLCIRAAMEAEPELQEMLDDPWRGGPAIVRLLTEKDYSNLMPGDRPLLREVALDRSWFENHGLKVPRTREGSRLSLRGVRPPSSDRTWITMGVYSTRREARRALLGMAAAESFHSWPSAEPVHWIEPPPAGEACIHAYADSDNDHLEIGFGRANVVVTLRGREAEILRLATSLDELILNQLDARGEEVAEIEGAVIRVAGAPDVAPFFGVPRGYRPPKTRRKPDLIVIEEPGWPAGGFPVVPEGALRVTVVVRVLDPSVRKVGLGSSGRSHTYLEPRDGMVRANLPVSGDGMTVIRASAFVTKDRPGVLEEADSEMLPVFTPWGAEVYRERRGPLPRAPREVVRP